MKKLGKVTEVFLPVGEELTNIGFKIQVNNELITIIEPQTTDNAKIYREDMVYVEDILIENNLQYKIIPLNNQEEVVKND